MTKKFGMIKHISMTWAKDFSLLTLLPKHCKKIYLKKRIPLYNTVCIMGLLRI